MRIVSGFSDVGWHDLRESGAYEWWYFDALSDDGATAFVHRNSRIMVNLATLYERSEEKSTHEAWVENAAAAVQQSDKGAYVNFLGDEGEARIRASYPGGTWDRLSAIKARYDPTNLFRVNQNIKPTV